MNPYIISSHYPERVSLLVSLFTMKSKQPCAYCGRTDTKLTKEHLWARSLHQRLQKSRGDKQHSFWLSRLDKVVETEPKLRDVCDVCNNGVLSQLDAYICALWDKYFFRIHERGEFVNFSYNYDLLCRWLLKLCYNSARIHKFDDFVYPPLVPYILNASSPVVEFELFLQIVPPGFLSVSELKEMGLPDDKALRWEPDIHRIGFAQFISNDGRKKILRAIHLRSYSFFLAFFQPGTTKSEINEFISIFLLQKQEVKHISPRSDSVVLLCDGMDALESFQGSHSKFIAG
ncbi:MAG: hypothetical protein V7L01_17480 [Nostoc sp.]